MSLEISNSRSPGPVWDNLPDEILVMIFGHLADVGSVWEEDDPLRLTQLPYRPADLELLPPVGLRGYPFLAQVCSRWRRLLDTDVAQRLVWRHVCIDLGHELVTSIHTPLRWSNARPSLADYHAAFQSTSLSASKILRFLGRVRPHVRRLTVANSEGFEGEGGEWVSLADKHDFGPAQLGWALAALRDNLTELVLHRCHDLVCPSPSSPSAPSLEAVAGAGGGVWGLLPHLPHLRLLAVEGLRGALPVQQAAALGEMRQLEALVLTCECRGLEVGLEGVPQAWSQLTSLTRLELRDHGLLPCLPSWLPCLPRLRHLDLSGCNELEGGGPEGAGGGLQGLAAGTGLQVLVLQRLSLDHVLPTPDEISYAAHLGRQPARRCLPDLSPLGPSLRSLSLAANCFSQLPGWLGALSSLEHLDVSHNNDLHIRSPLTSLAALPSLRLLDFRCVHVSPDEPAGYWCEAKCTTMQHLTRLARALKRRRHPQPRLLLDV
ncbi:hypothetical protein Agub_g3061 [Astrephomene gubernaculifera]|uniref:F-box domain-containing protein n=1 Tax=Astrephomene gubernaculifera TaxID=47775 RepID=A0AAD3DKE0_9CHLO|nr:hypothetical protein Agub_g3061 [Astrephomene gubernaculifera]